MTYEAISWRCFRWCNFSYKIYIYSKDYIDVAIPGMDSIKQVQQNINVLNNLELTEDDNKKIEEIRATLGSKFCRRCEYCLPCPVGVNIPQNFLLEGYYTRYNLKEWSKERYDGLQGKASECVKCGKCETKCSIWPSNNRNARKCMWKVRLN